MDFRKLEIGKRIIVEKSDRTQDQTVAVGERGTITNLSYDGYRVILTISFDNGEELVMDTVEFRFQVY
jgi:hypothetical protein